MADNSILSNIRILFVDSNKSTGQSLTTYFRGLTQLFATAESAEEALLLLEGPLWDIIICNLKLPGMNGLEFCRRVRSTKPKTKLILTSQLFPPSLEKRAEDDGIDEIVSTPIIPENLLSTMINVLSLSEASAPPDRRIKKRPDHPETVSILELDESMIITAFIRFNDDYTRISKKVQAWLQHNFEGARAIVQRKDQKLELGIEDIATDDTLLKLHQIPINLMNRVFVRKQLIVDLKKRGFLAFEVKRKPTEKTFQQKIRLNAIRRTEAFIGKVSDSIDIRNEISNTIHQIFTHNGPDKIDTSDLVSHIDGIIESGTAEALSLIATLKKGDHLYNHCIDVGAIFLTTYTRWIEKNGITSGFANDAEILLSAILHDIGKIFLPAELTESELAFDPLGTEMAEIRKHTIYSANVLESLGMPETAINMGLYHHIKQDVVMDSSYPGVVSYDEVLPETRLLAIVDMFQALVGQRPYKKSWPPSEAMRYIDQLAGLECDPAVWVAFRDALGWYPVGSLVELNDGTQAFVVEKAYYGLHRPSVVVTRNASDEELTHNTFFDLNTEKDIFIKRGLDQYKIYGDQAINRFLQLQVS